MTFIAAMTSWIAPLKTTSPMAAIIDGSYHRGMSLLELVNRHYPPNQVISVTIVNLSNKVIMSVVREL